MGKLQIIANIITRYPFDITPEFLYKTMTTVLLVEDSLTQQEMIAEILQKRGLKVSLANDGVEALEKIQANCPDLVVLDIIMPKMNGLDMCAKYRSSYGYKTPVIMLTALGTTDDIVKGLKAGADDYLVKPFSFTELEARIEALLRRASDTGVNLELRCGDLVLNSRNHKATRKNMDIDLTVKEYRLLEYFMSHQNAAISRMTLLKEVWDKNFDTNTNVVDVYVNYLRTKIDKDFEQKLIHTVVGVGYIMAE